MGDSLTVRVHPSRLSDVARLLPDAVIVPDAKILVPHVASVRRAGDSGFLDLRNGAMVIGGVVEELFWEQKGVTDLVHMENTTTEYLKYQFTDAELLAFAEQFALETQKKSAAEERQKEVVAQIKAEIAGHEKEIQRLSRYINQGYEYRDIDCTILFHDPAPKQKTIVRKDTGEVVKILAMDEEELQETLPLEAPEE